MTDEQIEALRADRCGPVNAGEVERAAERPFRVGDRVEVWIEPAWRPAIIVALAPFNGQPGIRGECEDGYSFGAPASVPRTIVRHIATEARTVEVQVYPGAYAGVETTNSTGAVVEAAEAPTEIAPPSPGDCPTCRRPCRARGEVRVHVWACGCAVAPREVLAHSIAIPRRDGPFVVGERVVFTANGGQDTHGTITHIEEGRAWPITVRFDAGSYGGFYAHELSSERVTETRWYADGLGFRAWHPLREGAIAAWRAKLAEWQREEDERATVEAAAIDVQFHAGTPPTAAETKAAIQRAFAPLLQPWTDPTVVASLIESADTLAKRHPERVEAAGRVLHIERTEAPYSVAPYSRAGTDYVAMLCDRYSTVRHLTLADLHDFVARMGRSEG